MAGGTTEHIITSFISSGFIPAWFMIEIRNIPVSSEVRSLTVDIRQLPTRVSPLKIPMALLVLPTSIASSMKSSHALLIIKDLA
jgi:hypothetical protein